MPARLRAVKRTLFASGAVFAAVLTFLSVQMLLGRDPSVHGHAQAQASKPAQTPEREGGSLLGSILSLAAGAVGDDDAHGGSAAPSLSTHTS